ATRRDRSVSCASGVMCPPATRTIVLPYSSVRASASVIIWNRFTRTLCYPCVPTRSTGPMEILISADEIQQRVRALAHDIRRDHPGGVHLVCVLKGAFVFL